MEEKVQVDGLPARLKALFGARQGVEGREERASSGAGDGEAGGEEGAARGWARALHGAFYAGVPVRGVNRFLEMEELLERVFVQLCGDDAFWEFAVRVVLLLAREQEQLAGTATENDASNVDTAQSERKAKQTTKSKKEKKTKKYAQPFTPLAFMTVNALRKVCEREESLEQQRRCREQGSGNKYLKDFCLRGLKDPSYVDQKLLVEIVDLFAVKDIDEETVRAVVENLVSTRSYTALIKLLGVFTTVEWSLEDHIKAMTSSKDWSSAELLVKTFDAPDKPLAKFLVEEAIAVQEFKRAHRIVHKFDLQDVYPDIEHLYSRDGLMKLIEKQRWDIAVTFAGTDESLRRVILNSMVASGELFRAMQLATVFQMDDFHIGSDDDSNPVSRGSPALHASTFTAAATGYLSFDLNLAEAVQFCDTEELIRQAHSFFFGNESSEPANGYDATSAAENIQDQIVGLDVEWKPISTKIASETGAFTTTAVASILQIATATRVFVIDLLALHNCSFVFDVFLTRLFNSPQYLKVGFGFDTDLKVLHQTFPERAACTSVSPFLELSTIIHKFFGASIGNSLSNATSAILGKPLDKQMQLSNWDCRPLSKPQMIYAALDAHCLVQIVDKLQNPHLSDQTNGFTLPPWQEVFEFASPLELTSPLRDDDIRTAIKLRVRYHAEWLDSKDSGEEPYLESHVHLRNPDTIKHYWTRWVEASETKLTSGISNLEFLPVAEAHEMLKAQTSSAHPSVATVNTICFFADERPCVACVDANCKLDTAQLAVLIGVSRRKIKLATGIECTNLFGFAPGTIPPFGHGRGSAQDADAYEHTIPIYVDISLKNAEYLLCGAGNPEVLLYLRSSVFFAVVPVEAVADIQRGVSAFSSKESVAPSFRDTVGEVDGSTVNQLKFLADSMVARVGKWLRTLGYDVVIWDPYASSKKISSHDHKSALLALAAREQRILLTRDKNLAARRDAGACFVVSSDDPHAQFREVRAHFALQLVEAEMMSRCAKCNSKGFDIVDIEYVRNQTDDVVHPNVLEVVTEFWICRKCHKVYWEGPKFTSSYENVRRMFADE